MTDDNKRTENRVRRLARRFDLRVAKARGAQHFNSQGLYQLIDARNVVVLGVNFDASLRDIEAFIGEQQATRDALMAPARWDKEMARGRHDVMMAKVALLNRPTSPPK